MADRTVAVRLRAITDQYKRDIIGAANTTKKFGTDAVGATKSVSEQLATVKTQSTIVGAALIGMAAASVVATAQFDKQMSGVAAVTGATAEEMESLRVAALKAGQATVFSASEAATAEAELAKAGVKTADILGGALAGSLDLAAAGQIDLGQAATISAQAMNTFGLKGEDVSHIADVLAAGANKSAADVTQLGDALRQGGLVAEQTGLTLEDTVGVLSAFADKALVGSDAGTSLKSMLQRLTPQSQQAAAMMDKLGLHAYDASGNFVGLAAYAENLKRSLSKLTPEARASALSVLFGSDAVRGANVLYDLGAKGVEDYTRAVNDTGAASRMAGTQLDNLAGDWEQLSGSIETAFINTGSNANGLLRGLTQSATGLVNIVGGLPAPLLATGGAAAVMAGAFLIAAPRVVELNKALATTPGLARAAGRALALTGALVGVEAVVALTKSMIDAQAETRDLDEQIGVLFGNLDRKASKANLDELWTQIDNLQKKLDDPGFGETLLRGLNTLSQNGFGNLATAMAGTETGYDHQLAQLKLLQGEYDKYKGAVSLVADTLGVDAVRAAELFDAANVGLGGDVVDTAAAVVDYATATASGSVASHKAAASLEVLGDSTASVEDQLKALQEQWDATTGALLGTSNATIAAEKALDDMSASIKENGNQWALADEKGRANQSTLNDSIQTFEDLRVKLIETGQATEEQANAKMVGYLTQLRDRLPASAKVARSELTTLIAKYSEIPASKTTTVEIKDKGYDTTLAHMNAVYARMQLLARGVNVTITSTGDINAHGGAIRRAHGGWVDGPGTGTSDSVRLLASRGEFVVNAASASRNAGTLQAINSGARLAGGSGGGDFTVRAPLELRLDSGVVWQGLLRLKRSRGGIALDLA